MIAVQIFGTNKTSINPCVLPEREGSEKPEPIHAGFLFWIGGVVGTQQLDKRAISVGGISEKGQK